MKRTLIRLEGKVVEIAPSAKGDIKARVLDDSEIFDLKVLESDQESAFLNDFNKVAQETYGELKQSLKNNLKKTILRTLGFEYDSYHDGWTVDHCNGRMSAVTNILTEQVQTLFRENATKAIEAEKDKIMKEAHASVKKEFRETFLRQIRDAARSKAQEAAHEYLEKMVAEQIQKHEKVIVATAQAALLGKPLPVNFDPENPDDLSTVEE